MLKSSCKTMKLIFSQIVAASSSCDSYVTKFNLFFWQVQHVGSNTNYTSLTCSLYFWTVKKQGRFVFMFQLHHALATACERHYIRIMTFSVLHCWYFSEKPSMLWDLMCSQLLCCSDWLRSITRLLFFTRPHQFCCLSSLSSFVLCAHVV